MSKKGKKSNCDYFNTTNGCVSAEHALPLPESLDLQIDQIIDTFPHITKEIAAVILQSYDFNLEQAIDSIGQDGAEGFLACWNTQGKRGKSAFSNRRNKKKNRTNRKSTTSAALKSNDGDSEKNIPVNTAAPDLLTFSTSSSDTRKDKKETLPLAANVHPKLEFNANEMDKNGNSLKRKPTVKDLMPRSVKDLQRSAVAIARFNLVFHENVETAEKTLNEYFRKIKECVNEREKSLTGELIAVKTAAVKSLDERQELAATLKQSCNHISTMQEEEVVELRFAIKSFIGDRKIDEQIAKTILFNADCEQMIQTIGSFGHVNPVTAHYKQNIFPPASHQQTVNNDNKSACDWKSNDNLVNQADISDHNEKKVAKKLPERPLSNLELLERLETHQKLKESLHQQSLQVNHETTQIQSQNQGLNKPIQSCQTEMAQPAHDSNEANDIKFSDSAIFSSTEHLKNEHDEPLDRRNVNNSATQRKRFEAQNEKRTERNQKFQRNGERREVNGSKKNQVQKSRADWRTRDDRLPYKTTEDWRKKENKEKTEIGKSFQKSSKSRCEKAFGPRTDDSWKKDTSFASDKTTSKSQQEPNKFRRRYRYRMQKRDKDSSNVNHLYGNEEQKISSGYNNTKVLNEESGQGECSNAAAPNDFSVKSG